MKKNIKDHNQGTRENKADYRRGNDFTAWLIELRTSHLSPVLPDPRQVIIFNTLASYENSPPD